MKFGNLVEIALAKFGGERVNGGSTGVWQWQWFATMKLNPAKATTCKNFPRPLWTFLDFFFDLLF